MKTREVIAAVLIVLLLALGFHATTHAQFSLPSGPSPMTNSQLSAWLASQLPTPFQATAVPTDASGNWSVTWNTSYASASAWTAVVDVGKILNAQGIICNKPPATQTANSIQGNCLQKVIAANGILGISISVVPVAPPVGTQVSVIALQRTQ